MCQCVFAKMGLGECGQQMKTSGKAIADVNVSTFMHCKLCCFRIISQNYMTSCVLFYFRFPESIRALLFLGCDCYEAGTDYCFKRERDYCKCKDGFVGDKCDNINHVVIVDSQANNQTSETAKNIKSSYGFTIWSGPKIIPKSMDHSRPKSGHET